MALKPYPFKSQRTYYLKDGGTVELDPVDGRERIKAGLAFAEPPEPKPAVEVAQTVAPEPAAAPAPEVTTEPAASGTRR